MPKYDFYCKECDNVESFEQSIHEDLVMPECPEHGEMIQDYNFGVRMVFGVGSSPSRPGVYGKKAP